MKKVFVVLFGILYGLGCQPSSEPKYTTCRDTDQRVCPVREVQHAFVEILEVEPGEVSVVGWRVPQSQPYLFGIRVFQDGKATTGYIERSYEPPSGDDTVFVQQTVFYDTIYPTAIVAEIEVRALGTATDAYYWKGGKVPIRTVSCAAQNSLAPQGM